MSFATDCVNGKSLTFFNLNLAYLNRVQAWKGTFIFFLSSKFMIQRLPIQRAATSKYKLNQAV